MLKKILISILIVLMLVCVVCIGCMAADESKVEVVLNGDKVAFDVEPQIVEGRTLVPFRRIFEELGFEVNWDAEKRIASGQSKLLDLKVMFPVGTPAVYRTIYGAEEYLDKRTIDVPASILKGRTLIPLRALSDSIGAEILWDGEERIATVNFNPYFENLETNVPVALEDPVQSAYVSDFKYVSYGEITDETIEVTYEAEVRGSGLAYLNFYDKLGMLIDYSAVYFNEGRHEYYDYWPSDTAKIVISKEYDIKGIEDAGGEITTNAPYKIPQDEEGYQYLFIHDCDYVSKTESPYPTFEGSYDYKFIIEAGNNGYVYANCFGENDVFLDSVYLYIFEGKMEYTIDGVPDGVIHIEFSKKSSTKRNEK